MGEEAKAENNLIRPPQLGSGRGTVQIRAVWLQNVLIHCLCLLIDGGFLTFG